MGFTNGTNYECMYTLTSAVTKNTYTTEAAFTGVVGTNTVPKIPGNYFGNDVPNPVGKSILLRARGIIGNTAAATFAVNLGFDAVAGTKGGTGGGSTAVMAATAPVATFTAPFIFEVEGTVTAFATSTFSIQVNGTWQMEGANSAGAAVATALRTGFQASITGLDPRIDLYLELFGTWSASNAANTTTVHQMKLYGEN